MSINGDATILQNEIRTDKSICFDLDSTLIHTFTEIRTIADLNIFNLKNRELRDRVYTLDLFDVVDTPGSGIYSRMWGAYRPHWKKFHDFCRKYFKYIIIWSAGQPRYVDAIVNILFPDPDFQPIVVYNWNQCVIEDDNIYKPLDLLYKDSRLTNLVGPENLYVIDDRDDTFSLNPDNGILIPVYKIDPTARSIMKDDMALLQLVEWFSKEEVANCSDIRTLDKSRIFERKRNITIRTR